MVACTNDTNSVDLEFNLAGELEADVRLRTIADGSITETAAGIGVALHPAGGIIPSSSGAGIKPAQSIHVGAEGVMKVNGYDRSQSPGSAPNANLARGVNTQFGNTITLNGQLPSNEVASYVIAHARWRGIWATNLTAFGGALLDRVDAYLQLQADGLGWITIDQYSLTRADQGGTFTLDYWHPFIMANATAHSLQARLLVGGGTVTGSPVQGVLESEYGGTLEWIY